jgi:ABC-type transporter Mla subunit MlaD
VQDQGRINDTLRTVDRTTEIYSRLLKKLDDQETQLEKLRGEEDELTGQIAAVQKQLEDYLSNLDVGQ